MSTAARPRRRTQHERTETTIDGLVTAARERFSTDGYTAASLDAIVEAAGVTKGALYHHFASKQALFRMVYEREQRRLLDAAIRAYQAEPHPWQAFEAGCQAFFDRSLEPSTRRITLLDAPAALGWEDLRDAEADTVALIELGLRRAMDAGCLSRRNARPLALLLFGALCQAAVHAESTDDPERARPAVEAELRHLLDALAGTTG